MHENDQSDKLSDTELSLKSLRPQAPSLDRARIAYEAGRRSARGSRLQPWLTAAAMTCAVGLAVAWQARAPNVVVRETVVFVEPPARQGTSKSAAVAPAQKPDVPTPASETITATATLQEPTYLKRRNLAIRLGVEALTVRSPVVSTAAPLRLGDAYRYGAPKDSERRPSDVPWSFQ